MFFWKSQTAWITSVKALFYKGFGLNFNPPEFDGLKISFAQAKLLNFFPFHYYLLLSKNSCTKAFQEIVKSEDVISKNPHTNVRGFLVHHHGLEPWTP